MFDTFCLMTLHISIKIYKEFFFLMFSEQCSTLSPVPFHEYAVMVTFCRIQCALSSPLRLYLMM